MFAQVLLKWMDIRLRALFDPDKPFGGIHLILCGDYKQLGPVLARSLYDLSSCNRNDSALVHKAQDLYELFTTVIELKINYRMKKKQGESQAATDARVALLKHQKRIAVAKCKASDMKYWDDFLDTDVPRRNEFNSDPETRHIVTDNATAAKLNAEFIVRIRDESKPVFSWNAYNSNATAMRADHNEVRGLRNFVGVCVGAPIILLSNLHTAAGLANGTQGTVRDVVFAEDSFENDVPLFVVCEFPGYTGPVFPAWADDPSKRTWVPIGVQTYGVRNRKTGSRTQIPIVVAKALTTWKAQGMSLDKIYVHVNKTRNKKGLFYTAVSRVTRPEGLLISSFDGELLDRIAASKEMQKVCDEMARLAELEDETREWIKREGIDQMFEFYFNKRNYNKKRKLVVPTSAPRLTGNRVSAAMDISNYSGDALGSEIADHTLAQDCAWRRRMQKENSRVFTIEQLLSMTPAPLGRQIAKKRKRRATSKSTQSTKKRRKVGSEKKLPAKRKRN
jgi:hypothetical protein